MFFKKAQNLQSFWRKSFYWRKRLGSCSKSPARPCALSHRLFYRKNGPDIRRHWRSSIWKICETKQACLREIRFDKIESSRHILKSNRRRGLPSLPLDLFTMVCLIYHTCKSMFCFSLSFQRRMPWNTLILTSPRSAKSRWPATARPWPAFGLTDKNILEPPSAGNTQKKTCPFLSRPGNGWIVTLVERSPISPRCWSPGQPRFKRRCGTFCSPSPTARP